jgi:hypothetical protein
MEKDYFTTAIAGDVGTLMVCMNGGINVETKSSYDNHVKTALHYASMHGHLKMIPFLSKDCNAHVETKGRN